MGREGSGWLLRFERVRYRRRRSWLGSKSGERNSEGRSRREIQCWKKDGEFSFRHTESLDTAAEHWVPKLGSLEFWGISLWWVKSQGQGTDIFPAHPTGQWRRGEAAISALSPGRGIFGWSAAWRPGADSAVTATAHSCAHTQLWGAARWWSECCGPHSKICPGGLCVSPSWKHEAQNEYSDHPTPTFKF